MSRPSEKFLIGPSRKFLLTAERLKDGTNRDEPRGTGLAGLVEARPRPGDDAAGSGGQDGSERALGAQVAGADEEAGRRRGGAWTAWTSVQSQAGGGNTEASDGDLAGTGLARFRANLCCRTAG